MFEEFQEVGKDVYSLINIFSFLNEENPVISINQCSLNGKSFLWTIVSRRCCFRAGTRLFTRGIDVQGNVANFVETEQIVEFGGDRNSFVQVSILNIFNVWNGTPVWPAFEANDSRS